LAGHFLEKAFSGNAAAAAAAVAPAAGFSLASVHRQRVPVTPQAAVAAAAAAAGAAGGWLHQESRC
jgi:hypothetical protein